MALSVAQKKANQRYNAKTYDQIKVVVKKGRREVIKEFAKSQGLSLNKYVNKLIDEDMRKRRG